MGKEKPIPPGYGRLPNGEMIRLPQGGSGMTQAPRGPDGMLLRDWIAGNALRGMLASGNDWHLSITSKDFVADRAYQYADAMLAAREVRQ